MQDDEQTSPDATLQAALGARDTDAVPDAPPVEYTTSPYNEMKALYAGRAQELTPRSEPLKLRIVREKKYAEAEVDRLSELLALLKANPSTGRILELLGRN